MLSSPCPIFPSNAGPADTLISCPFHCCFPRRLPKAHSHHEQRDRKTKTEDQRPWTRLCKFPDLDSTATLWDRWQSLCAQCIGSVLWENISDLPVLANEIRKIFFIIYCRCCICEVIQSIEQVTSLCGRMRVRHWCGNSLREIEAHCLSGWGMHEQYNESEISSSLLFHSLQS